MGTGNHKKCAICGFNRVIDKAHMSVNGIRIQKHYKNEPTIYLCPNHHRLYDSQELNDSEIELLPVEFRKYYLAESKIDKRRVLKKSIKRQLAPYLKGHKINGEYHYTYCRGAGGEIYLGTADAILRAVKGNEKA